MSSACSWSTCLGPMIHIRFLTMRVYGAGWRHCFLSNSPPPMPRESASLRRPYVYVLSESRLYYRHLVRGPWYLVRTHGPRRVTCLCRCEPTITPLSLARAIFSTN